jgi:hypothetical protein
MKILRVGLLLVAWTLATAPPLAAQAVTLTFAPEPMGQSPLESAFTFFVEQLRANESLDGLVEIETVPWAESIFSEGFGRARSTSG